MSEEKSLFILQLLSCWFYGCLQKALRSGSSLFCSFGQLMQFQKLLESSNPFITDILCVSYQAYPSSCSSSLNFVVTTSSGKLVQTDSAESASNWSFPENGLTIEWMVSLDLGHEPKCLVVPLQYKQIRSGKRKSAGLTQFVCLWVATAFFSANRILEVFGRYSENIVTHVWKCAILTGQHCLAYSCYHCSVSTDSVSNSRRRFSTFWSCVVVLCEFL